MTDFLQELEEEQDEAFVVDDDQKADWAVRRIRELEADTKKWKEYYAEQLKRVTEQNDNSVMYFKGLLASYFAHVPTNSPRPPRATACRAAHFASSSSSRST